MTRFSPAPRNDVGVEKINGVVNLRRLAKHEQDIVELRERVDFVDESDLHTQEMVFMEGEFLTAHEV